MAIVLAGLDATSSELIGTLFSNRSAAFMKMGSYQFARADAEDALTFMPNDQKARFRLASALLHLRSYRKALNVLRPIQGSTSNEDIQRLIRQLIVCVEENLTREYNIPAIVMEAQQNAQLVHADYCSKDLELRTSMNGGEGGRGIFAKATIPQGTLLVASKAIICAFIDDPEPPESIMDVNILRNFGDWTSVLPVFTRLAMMLSQGCGRAILDLEGGVNPTTNVDLWRDDVYDKTDKVPQVSFDFLFNLVCRNGFAIRKAPSNESVEGLAVFHVPSFFNHSCMANTLYYQIGDMSFIRSSITISEGSEIFINYDPGGLDGASVQARDEKLNARSNGFSCHCPLCQFELENASIVASAAKLVKEILEKCEKPNWNELPSSVETLKQVRLYLFKQFNQPIPEHKPLKLPMFMAYSTPRQLSLGKLFLFVLQRLWSCLRTQDRYDESIPYLTEIHALIKHNLNFGSTLGINSAANATFDLGVLASHSEMATFWLEELKCLCLLIGGKKFFEGKYLSQVKKELEMAERGD